MRYCEREKSFMPPDAADAAYIHDMLQAGEAVLRYLSGKSRAAFDSDEILRDAIERRIEIFGEAARRISAALQDAHPEISWRKITATRHILAHDYGDVDLEIVRRIATQHLPETLTLLRALMPPPPETGGESE